MHRLGIKLEYEFNMNTRMIVFIVRQETVNISRFVKAMSTPFPPFILVKINKFNTLTTGQVHVCSFRVAIAYHVGCSW